MIAILSGRGGRRVVVVLVSAAKGASQRAVTWWDRLLIWLAEDLFCRPLRVLPGFRNLGPNSFFSGRAPQDANLVFRRVLVLRAVIATAVTIAIGTLDPFGLSSDSARYSRDAFYQFVERWYPGLPDRDAALAEVGAKVSRPAASSVVLLTETDLVVQQETWPTSYGLHAEVLEELLNYEPEAVFVDIAFIDERSDESWDDLVEVACFYAEEGVPLYVASPRFVHAYALSGRLVERLDDVDALRATRIQTLARAGAVPVAVPGAAFGRDGLVYPFGVADKLVFKPDEVADIEETEAQWRRRVFPAGDANNSLFAAHEEGDASAVAANPCAEDAKMPPSFPQPAFHGESRYFVERAFEDGSAPRFFLPSAACAAYLAERHRLGLGNPPVDWCQQQFAKRPKDGALEVYWRFRNQEEQQFSADELGESFHVRNGMGRNEAGRTGLQEVCRVYSQLGWRERSLLLLDLMEDPKEDAAGQAGAKSLLAAVPGPWMRETCPPFHYLTVSHLLPGAGGIMSERRERILAEAVTGKVVMYGVQLVAVWDKVVPPTHWPLPGVFFHAMAYDNLRLMGRRTIGEDTRTVFAGLNLSDTSRLLVLLLLALPVELYKTFVAELGRVVADARLRMRIVAFGYALACWLVVNAFALLVLIGVSALLFFEFRLAPLNFSGILALIVAYSLLGLLNNLRLLTRLSDHVDEADRRRLQKRGSGV